MRWVVQRGALRGAKGEAGWLPDSYDMSSDRKGGERPWMYLKLRRSIILYAMTS